MGEKITKPVIQRFTGNFVRENNFRLSRKEISNLKNEWKEFVHNIPAYPNDFFGKGIVMCAGGFLYIPCAWVSIAMLRKLGCNLPIELWYEGNEINSSMIQKFQDFNVTCINCNDYSKAPLKGYVMKPFAILHSSFKEVLFLDADNNCVRDPSYLFDCNEYIKHGTIFWPDAWTTAKSNMIWKVVNSTAYDTIEQESGQLLINKEKCWKELNLSMHFNVNHQIYYKMLLGDKDTFKFAWLALKSTYYMIPKPVGSCGYMNANNEFYGFTMVQHDPDGEILFLHRNLMKWSLVNDEKELWTTIKRRKSDDVRFAPKTLQAENLRFGMVDISGDVETCSFVDLFGDYESTCLEILKDFRSSKSYAQLLQHLFIVQYRKDFISDLTQLLNAAKDVVSIPVFPLPQ